MGDILHQSKDPQTPEELYRLYRTLSEQLRGQLSQIENDKHELEIQMMDRVGSLESRNLELREQLTPGGSGQEIYRDPEDPVRA